MKAEINGAPAFAYIHIDLDPGESIIAESDAMTSMAADLDMTARLNGNVFQALCKKYLGGESLFVNEFKNNTDSPRRLTLTQATPGEILEIKLSNEAICLQPGAYISSSTGLTLGLRWAGLASFIGREGLFKLFVHGTGTLWYGAYGSLLKKNLDGEMIVDTGHLVAYDPGIKLKIQLAGGIFSSFFGGEGLVTRLEGKGNVTLQTRSLSGLKGWLNPRLR